MIVFQSVKQSEFFLKVSRYFRQQLDLGGDLYNENDLMAEYDFAKDKQKSHDFSIWRN